MIHFFKSDLGFIYGGKSKTRHEHKIQKSSSLGSISTFWVKPEPQPHLFVCLIWALGRPTGFTPYPTMECLIDLILELRRGLGYGDSQHFPQGVAITSSAFSPS